MMQVTLTDTWTGADLRRWRDSLRLSQAELANLLGVSRRSVISWEAAEAEPVGRMVILACRTIEQHQDQIGAALAA
jgi:DNA-binding transcriptional regulator YiaG